MKTFGYLPRGNVFVLIDPPVLFRILDLSDLPQTAATILRKELSPSVTSVVCHSIATEHDIDPSRAQAGKRLLPK